MDANEIARLDKVTAPHPTTPPSAASCRNETGGRCSHIFRPRVSLVVKLQGKLYLPRIIGCVSRRSDLSKVGAREVGCTGYGNYAVSAKPRSVEVWMVGDVEELGAELQEEALREPKILECREVKSLERGSGDLSWGTSQ